MKLTMWRVVVVLNMPTKFRKNSLFHLSYIVQPLFYVGKMKQTIQGHPTSIFGKHLFGRRFEI